MNPVGSPKPSDPGGHDRGKQGNALIVAGQAAAGPTRLLAEFAQSFEVSSAPRSVRHAAERILVDCIGCAVAGLVTPAGQIALDLVKDERGQLNTAAVATGRVSIGPAAFANTILTNALDFEPVGPEGHVCAVAVPVALATADATNTSGEEMLAGLLVGLEVGGRVGGAIRRVLQSGTNLTPFVRGTAHAAFAAAAAAGRILGLTTDQMVNAFGIAAYAANVPTLKKVMVSPRAAMTKYDHLGVMSQAGIQAVLLAQRGFTGDPEALEGDYGFWRITGALGCDWGFLIRDLGTVWTISDTWFKRYPVMLYANPGLDIIRRLVRQHNIPISRIQRINARETYVNAVQSLKDVRNELDAWTSYAYNAAAAAADVHPWRSWQEPQSYRRPDLLELASKVQFGPLHAEQVPGLGNYWEGQCPVRITIQLEDGQVLDGAANELLTLDDSELSAKFAENVGGLLEASAAKRLEQCCWDPAALPHTRELGDLLIAARLPAARWPRFNP